MDKKDIIMNELLLNYIIKLMIENAVLQGDAEELATYAYISDLCAEYGLNTKQRNKALKFFDDTNDKEYIDTVFCKFIENDIF